MDKLQKTFKENYAKRLKDEVRAGLSIPKYSLESYEYDESMVKYVANVYQPEGLLEKMMNASSDFEAAKALFEAYKGISPLLASLVLFL